VLPILYMLKLKELFLHIRISLIFSLNTEIF
jgi:hypothetical protein